jgi:hypothetical protein
MAEYPIKLTIGDELELNSLSDVAMNNLHAELIDYSKDENLIISHPLRDEIPVEINPGERFIVEINQGSDDVCFETEIVAVLNEPQPRLQTTYPDKIRTGSIRKSSRVPAAPANIQLIEDGVSETEISFLNVSCSGACLVADRSLGVVNDMFNINFQTDDDEPDFAFTCMIRYVHEKYQNQQQLFNHGVVFIGMDAETQLFLWKYFQKSAALQSELSS